MWTTVSTAYSASTRAMAGWRMSARTNSAPPEMVLGRHRVDADHPVHLGIPLNAPHEAAPQLAGHPGDEHDLAQDQRLPFWSTLASP